MIDNNWNEFCELYYETAKKEAELQLKRLISRNSNADKRIDSSYVVDAAVLAALEKTFTHFDVSRSVKITTYLSRLIHNEIVDEYNKESKAAARQDDIDDIKTSIKSYTEIIRKDYLLYESKNTILANNIPHKSISHIEELWALRPNPITPSLDCEAMAKRFYTLIIN